MNTIIKFSVFFLLFLTTACVNKVTTSADTKQHYQCPMKCESDKTYEQPGDCPVCGMDLKEQPASHQPAAATPSVKISGALRSVMHEGKLGGTIALDTISSPQHLYGLGPVEGLAGEILVLDGKAYVSTVRSPTSMRVDSTYAVKAPFFVYANVEQWQSLPLPENVLTIPQLEAFLDSMKAHRQQPFAFKLTGMARHAAIHVVNLPKGKSLDSPRDAHRHQQTYLLQNEAVEIVGFFSTDHQGVFTHHDAYVHLHLITPDRTKMGHLDELTLVPGTTTLSLAQ